jgi:pimeloyl-ACP methyl ester carboxylesterase
MVYTDPVVYDWAHIKVKALVIGGEKDGADFPERATFIADTIRGAQAFVAPNAGHVLHMEDPTLFNRELVKFLKSDLAAPTQNRQ